MAQAGLDVAAGDADIVLICGAEAWRTRSATPRDRREDLGWTTQDDTVPPGRARRPRDVQLNHPAEIARQVYVPPQVYALFEQALRAAAGRPIDDHLVRVSELWAGFNAVAVANPHAWIRDAADRRADPHPDARQPLDLAGRTRRS